MGFVAEIVLFAGVGISAFRLVGEGPSGAVIAATAVVATVIVWAVLMAPGASHRLPAFGRAVLAFVVGAAATVVLAVTGSWSWPVLTGVATLVLLAATTRGGSSTPAAPTGRHARPR